MKMNKVIYLFLLIPIIILTYNQVVYAVEQYSSYNDYIYYVYVNSTFFNTYGDYDLSTIHLRLPEQNVNSFSPEAQNELLNLAALYANRSLNLEQELEFTNSKYNMVETLTFEKLVNNQSGSLVLTPLPGVLLNADFNKEKADFEIEEKTNISLQYWMNKRTLISAEYDMASRKWWDSTNISLGSKEFLLNSSEKDNVETNDANKKQEVILNEEKNEKSRVGISYKTSDRVTISADYIEGEDGIEGDQDYSTVLGVQYADERGILKYHYQIDFDEIDLGNIKKMESGVELGIRDLATFNASYQLLNPSLLEDQLKESIWDFGLDVNLSDISLLSLGYQLKSNQEPSLNVEEETEKESNIKAQLEIKF